MGSEVELIEEDAKNTVFVAVGKNVKDSKSLLLWTSQFFTGLKICLLHIHQPYHVLTLLDDKLSASKLKEHMFKAWRELELQKMHKLLNQYTFTLSQIGVNSSKMWIDADNVEIGIVETIAKHGVQHLVMGAAAEKLYSKDMSEPKSNKAIYVSQHAPISCKIWFACKGHLIYTREKAASPTSYLKSIVSLSPSPAAKETSLIRYQEPHADMAVNSVLRFSNNSISIENDFSTSTSTHLMINDATGNGLTLISPRESRDQLVQSLSTMLLEGHKGLSSSDLQEKLENAVTDAKNSKQKAFEESIKRWRAEEDANEALSKAEESESSCREEVTRREEIEAILATKSREIEKMKNERAKYVEEIQIVKDETRKLVDRISKARETERELEEKIVQAVNLLITFKERRDKLQDERDNARRQINRLAKYVNEEDTNLSRARFYKPSILEIMEATQDFNQTLSIGDGRYGSVYKGMLRHVRVAIKMLPSVGSQRDAEFEHEAEVLSRIRHPNIVTLIGVCPETRSIIYEYLENGNLEDKITSLPSTSPLPWHTRIKIASEICSALIFLHGSKPQIIHGNVKLTNILLDSNHVSKLSDLGINRLIFCNDIDTDISAYTDPALTESGKLSVSSDVYSFGVVLLKMLTGRPALSVVKDTKCALENGNFSTILDSSGRDWPIEHAKELAYLGLRCCEKNPRNRPELVDDILTKLVIMDNLFTESPVESPENNRRIPSYFVCPIFQEVMKDPYIAADGFTYEEDAIRGWLNSGHMTSPMTNLILDHCDLLPNHALSFAIQEWLQHS